MALWIAELPVIVQFFAKLADTVECVVELEGLEDGRGASKSGSEVEVFVGSFCCCVIR